MAASSARANTNTESVLPMRSARTSRDAELARLRMENAALAYDLKLARHALALAETEANANVQRLTRLLARYRASRRPTSGPA